MLDIIKKIITYFMLSLLKIGLFIFRRPRIFIYIILDDVDNKRKMSHDLTVTKDDNINRPYIMK